MSELNTPTNYHDFRKRFLDAAQMRGLQLHSLQVRGLSPQGRPLFTDIAHNVLNPNLPTLIHISGCHGIEGYIGSAIQSFVLESENFPKAAMTKLNLVFVHALNPYGMSWYRRVNGRNIDLNRNYFKASEVRPQNIDFDKFTPLFEKNSTQKRWRTWLKVLMAIIKLGQKKTAIIIASGQYHQPDSLFYGGTENEPEVVEVVRYLQRILSATPKVFVIDVHSGLGKFGSENLLLDQHQSDEDKKFWTMAFEKEVINPGDNPDFYWAQGALSSAFRDFFPKSKVHYIFQEFGTRSQLSVLRSLISEHRSFLKLILDRSRAFLMLATFYPYQDGWRIKCVKMGSESYLRVVRYFCSNSGRGVD